MGLTLPWHLEVGIIVMVIGPHDVRSLTLELKGWWGKGCGFCSTRITGVGWVILGWLVC